MGYQVSRATKEGDEASVSVIGVIVSKTRSPISSTGFTNFWIVFFVLADAKHSLKWFRQAPPSYSQPILAAF
jgi:hypothetical protein